MLCPRVLFSLRPKLFPCKWTRDWLVPLGGRRQVVAASTFIMEVDTAEDKLDAGSSRKTERRRTRRKAISSGNHVVKRRVPFRLPKQTNDVYVNTKTNFKAYVEKCEKILDSDAKEVVIYGLGAAVRKASKLAKRLQELHHDTLQLDVKTSTVNLIDDLEPTNDEADYEINERKISAVQIRVFRTALIGTLRFEEKKT